MKPGDFAVLKIGGPIMLVIESTPKHTSCIWFSTTNEMQEKKIPTNMLEPMTSMICNACGSQFEPMEIPISMVGHSIGGTPIEKDTESKVSRRHRKNKLTTLAARASTKHT